jgi:hypothetical protein
MVCRHCHERIGVYEPELSALSHNKHDGSAPVQGGATSLAAWMMTGVHLCAILEACSDFCL